MELNEREYECIARWLDGEEVELTDRQRQVAMEIRRDEQRLAGLLDVGPAEGAIDRAHRRMEASSVRVRRWPLRLGQFVAVAAAIMLIVGIGLWLRTGVVAPEGVVVVIDSPPAVSQQTEALGLDIVEHCVLPTLAAIQESELLTPLPVRVVPGGVACKKGCGLDAKHARRPAGLELPDGLGDP